MKIYHEAVGWEWRSHFAWRPIQTEDYKWIWLEWCEKKIFNCPIDMVSPSSWVIYRRIIK